MWGKLWWPIELILIIGIFGIPLKMICFIELDYFDYILSAQTIILIGNTLFLILALYRINHVSENNNHSAQYFFKNKFLFNDIWIVLILFILSGLTYNLIMRIEFVHIFAIGKLPRWSHLTSFQYWSMISLIALSSPIGIIAEELYFRCYLFEIQNTNFKNYTWIVNGFSWCVYHVFTPTNFLAFLPTCLMYSYIYQKRRNIWITIITHFINNFYRLYFILKFL